MQAYLIPWILLNTGMILLAAMTCAALVLGYAHPDPYYNAVLSGTRTAGLVLLTLTGTLMLVVIGEAVLRKRLWADVRPDLSDLAKLFLEISFVLILPHVLAR